MALRLIFTLIYSLLHGNTSQLAQCHRLQWTCGHDAPVAFVSLGHTCSALYLPYAQQPQLKRGSACLCVVKCQLSARIPLEQPECCRIHRMNGWHKKKKKQGTISPKWHFIQSTLLNLYVYIYISVTDNWNSDSWESLKKIFLEPKSQLCVPEQRRNKTRHFH